LRLRYRTTRRINETKFCSLFVDVSCSTLLTPFHLIFHYHNRNKKGANVSFPTFEVGQQAVYTSYGRSYYVTVKEIHQDDDGVPYYTIDFDGREKQTDAPHLSHPPTASTSNGSSNGSTSNGSSSKISLPSPKNLIPRFGRKSKKDDSSKKETKRHNDDSSKKGTKPSSIDDRSKKKMMGKSRKEKDEALKEKVLEYYNVPPNRGGGQCMFRATSQHEYGEEKFWRRVKKEIFDFMGINDDFYEDFLAQCHDEDYNAESLDDYIRRMRDDDGAEGGEMELHAAAYLYGRLVVVHDSLLPKPRQFPDNDVGVDFDNPMEFIRTGGSKLGKGAHYEAMVPLDADEVDSTASSAAADGGSDDELNEVLGKSVDDDNDEDRESPLKVDTSGQFAYAIM